MGLRSASNRLAPTSGQVRPQFIYSNDDDNDEFLRDNASLATAELRWLLVSWKRSRPEAGPAAPMRPLIGEMTSCGRARGAWRAWFAAWLLLAVCWPMGVALRRHAVGDLAGDLPRAHDIRRRRASDAQHYVIITNLCFMRKITVRIISKMNALPK